MNLTKILVKMQKNGLMLLDIVKIDDRRLPVGINKKVKGKMKDEFN